MQNKLYTTQFSHYSMTDLQSVPEQRLWNSEIAHFLNFTKLSKKTKLMEKFKLAGQQRIQAHRKQKTKMDACPSGQTPFTIWPWHLWYAKFTLVSLFSLPGCAPSQLLHPYSLAEYGRLKKVLSAWPRCLFLTEWFILSVPNWQVKDNQGS